MRLYQKRGIYYVEFKRGKSRSLGIRNKRIAQTEFNKIKKLYLQGKILKLESSAKLTLEEFKKRYTQDPDRRDLSPDTHRADELALRLFMNAVGDINIDSIHKSHIAEFKTACSARGVKPTSINSYLRHIRAAMNYAHNNDMMLEVPPHIKYLKTGKRLPRVISGDDLDKIRAMAVGKKPEMARIIEFAIFTGTRRAEIVNAKYEHMHDGAIMIKGKGNKERIIPLLPPVMEILKDQAIGNVFSYRHVSTVSNYYREITRAAGVDSRFHDLRHTSATQMLTQGIPLEVVQSILGHAEIRTTQIYAQVVSETKRKEMEKLSF